VIVTNNIKTNYSNKSKIKLLKKFNRIFKSVLANIYHQDNILNILNKKFTFNFEKNKIKKFQKYKTIAIVGMGGSILGAEALYSFLKKKIRKKVYFFNDLDQNKIDNFKKKEILSSVLFIIISKSGNTVETLSNTFLLKIIKKNAKNVIIISEKKDNLLFNLSKKLNLFYIEHKNYIGGRFSVLSEVGIVPAYLMGVNVFKLRSQILNYLKGANKKILKDSSIKLSEILISKKKNNLILLNYSPELDKLLYWCQQLIAESLGKKNMGFLPVISTAPKDHHSLLQLYLDGPKDKIFYIFSSEIKSKIKIKVSKFIDKKNMLNNKLLSSVKNAQKNALIKTLKKKGVSYREFKFKKIEEKSLGKFFSYFILETIFIGRLSNINPFNQPAVEQVKKYTKLLLN